MENIVERYTALIRRAIQRQDNVRAHRYITRGLQVQPGNRHLLALQDSMKVPDVSVETGTRASRVTEGPSELEKLFSWVKTFVNKGQSGVEKGYAGGEDGS